MLLASQGVIVREKGASNSFGRPRFARHVPSRTIKQALLSSKTYVKLVALPFSRLRHVCRFEQGGYCKAVKEECAPQNYSETRKRNYSHFRPISGFRDKPARANTITDTFCNPLGRVLSEHKTLLASFF
jgi:hypothetical protein